MPQSLIIDDLTTCFCPVNIETGMNTYSDQPTRPRIVKLISFWNFALALFGFFVFSIYLTPMKPSTVVVAEGKEVSYSLPLALGILIISLAHFLVGLGEWQGQSWSLRTQRVLAIPFLLGFPLGTLYALLVYLGLRGPKVSRHFS